MAATPKPVRKQIKKVMPAMRKALDNPKHNLTTAQKKEHKKSLTKDVKSHFNSSKEKQRFRKKHPGEVYER